jgi:DNA gyrase/topoisomerase IV subunit A
LKTAKSDVDEKLAKALKITVEQAKTILDKSVRSLSSLSKDKLLSEIKELKNKIDSDSAKYKSPRKTIYNWIKGLQI